MFKFNCQVSPLMTLRVGCTCRQIKGIFVSKNAKVFDDQYHNFIFDNIKQYDLLEKKKNNPEVAVSLLQPEARLL